MFDATEVKKGAQVFWSRVVLGGAIGIASSFLDLNFGGGVGKILSVILAVVIFLLFGKLIEGRAERMLGSKRKAWMEGAGSYFIAWFFTWSLALNLIFHP